MSLKYMKESYLSFKHICGGKVPFLTDYLKHDGSIDPARFTVFSPNYKTYFDFVSYIENETHPEFSLMNEDENFRQIMQLLSFYSPAKHTEEWIASEAVFNSGNYSAAVEEIEKLAEKYLSAVNKNSILHSCRTLSGTYFDSSENKRYEKAIFSFDGKYISFNENTVNSLERSEFSAEKKLWLEDLIQYNLLRFQAEFGPDDYSQGGTLPFLKLYQKYTMCDTALLSCYTKIHSSFRSQGLITSAKLYTKMVQISS